MTNQIQKNEAQFFAIEKKGRDGLQSVIDYFGNDMWAMRPSYLPDARREGYFKRILTAISNDEKLKPLTHSKKGLFTLYQNMCKIVELGLNIGGIRPHAYLTAFGESVTLIPTADGYKYVVTTGEHALFKDVLCGIVHQNDKEFRIDEAAGEIKHPFDPLKERGEIVGVWVKCISNDPDSVNVVKFVPLKRIIEIRDNHSSGWKAFKNGKMKDSPWNTDAEEMYQKTAVKVALKPYIGQCEGLSALSGVDNEAIQSNDVNTRMESRIDNITSQNQEVPIKDAPKVVSTQDDKGNEKKEEKQPDTGKKDGDLF